MNVLLAFVVFVLIVAGGIIGYGLFGINLLGVITQFLIAGIGAWLWDKSHPKYVCKVCGFKSASEQKMRDHIRKNHIAASPEAFSQHFKEAKKKTAGAKQKG
ncbi:MAG: hypothetical protein LVQ97_02865 [Candidatus Micrarchaeales archaeon]|jgi:hypothetical protein|nr:hypothetical protein [Candidatus Micrarchaeales archaeon]